MVNEELIELASELPEAEPATKWLFLFIGECSGHDSRIEAIDFFDDVFRQSKFEPNVSDPIAVKPKNRIGAWRLIANLIFLDLFSFENLFSCLDECMRACGSERTPRERTTASLLTMSFVMGAFHHIQFLCVGKEASAHQIFDRRIENCVNSEDSYENTDRDSWNYK